MNTTVSLDSFQLIIGIYLLYISVKGEGNMYRFFDIPEENQPKVKKVLRTVYAFGGVIALTEAALCMFSEQLGIPVETVNILSAVCTLIIVVILVGAISWLRTLAKK